MSLATLFSVFKESNNIGNYDIANIAFACLIEESLNRHPK